ncbi:hypothetical protein CT0861_04631 [Colletotrichum tofieldiae]|uniref:Uncharacterized protein n=1 Tax=Colletotrichum tofieldiae TaxID=708197 RepID=A0A166RAQ2_9PEZI|nr:hypothetical protein CT0861_04631 [Colletotrichum tofieldiae]
MAGVGPATSTEYNVHGLTRIQGGLRDWLQLTVLAGTEWKPPRPVPVPVLPFQVRLITSLGPSMIQPRPTRETLSSIHHKLSPQLDELKLMAFASRKAVLSELLQCR